MTIKETIAGTAKEDTTLLGKAMLLSIPIGTNGNIVAALALALHEKLQECPPNLREEVSKAALSLAEFGEVK